MTACLAVRGARGARLPKIVAEFGIRRPAVPLLKRGDEVLVGADPVVKVCSVVCNLVLGQLIGAGQNLAPAARHSTGRAEKHGPSVIRRPLRDRR